MSSEIIEPPLGTSGSQKTPSRLPEGQPPSSDDTLPEMAGSPVPPMAVPGGSGTSSADGLSLPLSEVSPDPFLDEFQPPSAPDVETGTLAVPPRAVGAAATTASPLDAINLDVPPGADVPPAGDVSSGVLAVVAAIDLDSKSKGTGGRAGSASSKPPASPERAAPVSSSRSPEPLDLYAPPLIRTEEEPARGKATKLRKEPARTSPEEEDSEGDGPARGPNWWVALLASYASAVTLGLIWVLWSHRQPRETSVEADLFPPAEHTSDPGIRAGQSRSFVPPQALPADRVAALGQTLHVGSLEVTPLEVAAGPVTLKREISEFAQRRAGEGALMLKLRLKNLASDSILVPLDEAFIRERGRGVRDSFIQTGASTQIDMYPLAVVSEWSIVGQEFRELRPGESYETLVVSAPEASGRLTPEMTWRIRLRTEVNRTETVGVRFKAGDVRILASTPNPEPDEQGTSGTESP